MEADTDRKFEPPRLNPLLAGAAISLIVLSIVGIGAITGLLPKAQSPKQGHVASAHKGNSHTQSPASRASHAEQCTICGTIDAIRTVEIRGDASGLGAIAGGVTGAVIGNQLGQGRGNTAMTVLGTGGGAYAGNQLEKNVKKRLSYRITVRMDDGTFRTVSQATRPEFAVGEKVRVVAGTLARA